MGFGIRLPDLQVVTSVIVVVAVVGLVVSEMITRNARADGEV